MTERDDLISELRTELAQVRERESKLRREVDSILHGLQTLISPANPAQLFSDMVDVFRPLLGFEHVIALRPSEGGGLVPEHWTEAEVAQGHWPIGAVFQRVLSGEVVPAFDVRFLPEWRAQPAAVGARVRSALHVGLPPGTVAVMLVFTHSQAGAFTSHHVRVIQRLAPLFGQALRTAEALELQHELLKLSHFVSMGHMFAGVAHDVNTPLGVAVTALSVMRDAVDELTATTQTTENPALRRNFQRIERASQLVESNVRRASDLIRAFKEVSIDQSRQERSIISLKTYVQTVVDSLAPLVKRLKLHVELTPHSPNPMLSCVPGHIAQVVTNMVENAGIHGYGGTGGHVRIDIIEEPGNIVLRVSDKGCGMSEEIQQQCLRPLFTTRAGQGGSGLGLFVVQHVCQNELGATLHLDSQLGLGTTWTIAFPRDARLG